jgi:hypothetical protein
VAKQLACIVQADNFAGGFRPNISELKRANSFRKVQLPSCLSFGCGRGPGRLEAIAQHLGRKRLSPIRADQLAIYRLHRPRQQRVDQRAEAGWLAVNVQSDPENVGRLVLADVQLVVPDVVLAQLENVGRPLA